MRYVFVTLSAALSAAHVILENPKPFRFQAYGPSNPISPDGSDFPCKLPPGAKLELDGAPKIMAIGEEQSASFLGPAVHGGGSCQFSLSGPVSNGDWAGYPVRSSDWKVFHSIEGGCPARNQKGNIDGPNQDKYSFKIPEGIEPGDYVFSWTWLARIGGEPEYYQNCAPITVVPAKTKRMSNSDQRGLFAKRVGFPQLFMANTGDISGGCTTEEALQEQVAIAFPDPGPSVDHPEGTGNLFKQQCDGNPKAGKAQNGGPVGALNSSASQPSSTPVEQHSTSSTLLPSSSSLTSTYSMTPSSSAESIVPSSSPGACIEGHLTCLGDGTHFATCTGGQLTPPQPIALGFKCKVGSSVGLDISPA
ncbi:uncharacterized protein F4822DRAFT_430405 [Hypoxylon trugodes]|uniref:uncharacterized protein n=1 Tax=Hypoxylon trugodes TaxID=326681 RepID=UPI00219588C5|nr:uncharacterized protein F4822DRAFT_430405 [Hypoxylon trugodes]KAI1387658.1 hypothetical protein F4822DRAFT_430405 [Hypoxylon trugodes]